MRGLINCYRLNLCHHRVRLPSLDYLSVVSRLRRRYSSVTSPIRLSVSEYNQSSSSPLCPVLMTHGLLGSKQNWNSIAKATSKATSRRVITFDARNHGESPHSEGMNYELMVNDVMDLAKQLQLPKFVFLGHSMGGRTVAATALKHSDRLSGIVVVDISPLNLGGDFDEMKLYLETMNSIIFAPTLTLSEARKEADSRLKAVVQDAAIRAFLLTNIAKGPSKEDAIVWKPNLPVLLRNLHEIKHFPPNLLQNTTNIPCLFARGQKSPFVPDSDFDGIRRLFPNVEFVTVPNSGHWPQADNPTEFIRILVQFLKGVP